MEHEYAVISAIFKNPQRMSMVTLEPDDFSDSSCRMIWKSIQDVAREYPVDIVTVSERLARETGQNWVKVVGTIANSPGVPNHLESYCKTIQADSLQRKAREICARVAHGEGDVDLAVVTSELLALTRDRSSQTYSFRQTIAEAYNDIEAAFTNGGIPGISTGFQGIDNILGGFHNSDLVVFGGRPSMGKTAFLISLMLKCQAKSFFVSGEMAFKQVGSRLISQQSRVSATTLRNGSIQESDWPKLTAGMQALLGRSGWIYDKPNPTIQDVMQGARMARHEHGIEIMYVDYLQKIRSHGKASRVDEIEDVVMGLKDIGRELDIPVVALAQVNRECEKRPDKRPVMSDLKGAGAIEQEADAIAFLYRDHVYNDDANETEAELNWEKNRHGPIGLMRFQWCPRTMTFSDFDNYPGAH